MSPSVRHALVASRIEHLPLTVWKRPLVVVDVGANAGQWLLALQRFAPVARLYAFKPNPVPFAALQAALGGRPGVDVRRVALGDRTEELTLHVTRDSSLSSLLAPLEVLREQFSHVSAEVVRSIVVPVSTLDREVPGDVVVDILKIDVQGYELRVLSGGRDTLRRTRTLLVEVNFRSQYEGADTLGPLHRLLVEDHGFVLYDLSRVERGRDGRALWADAVFVNPRLLETER